MHIMNSIWYIYYVTWLWKCCVCLLPPFWSVVTQAEWGQGDPFGCRPISSLQDFNITAHKSCRGALEIGARMIEKKCVLGCLSDAVVLGVTTRCWCSSEFMRRKEHCGKVQCTLFDIREQVGWFACLGQPSHVVIHHIFPLYRRLTGIYRIGQSNSGLPSSYILTLA